MQCKWYLRYMDDNICNVSSNHVDAILDEMNKLHPNLHFTVEREADGSISFLDMLLTRGQDGSITVSWYRKKTDTNVYLNYFSVCPMRYKRSVVQGVVHRLFHISSSWSIFHDSLVEAKKLLECNQYPPAMYNAAIRRTIENILRGQGDSTRTKDPSCNTTQPNSLFIQYRGFHTDWFMKRIGKITETTGSKVNVIPTTKKLCTLLPSLKAPVPMHLKSSVVYQITCPGCAAQYIGQTVRHLVTRCKEHGAVSAPVGIHFRNCGQKTSDLVQFTKILEQNTSQALLLKLEAIHIARHKPSLNSREEFRSRQLSLRF